MNFDWDDNIIFMPTKIAYFSKDKTSSHSELLITTDLFAKTRLLVGQQSYKVKCSIIDGILCDSQDGEIEVDLIDYEILAESDLADHSFRSFRDCERKFFINDLKQALKNKSFGPSFDTFVYACSKKESAKNTTIITARGHAPESMYEGLKLLKQLGYLKHLPPLSNIFPVSYKPIMEQLGGSASNPSQAKCIILLNILDQIKALSDSTHGHIHSFGFSDDDLKTYRLIENTLKEHLASGKWSGIDISLFFTGRKKVEKALLTNFLTAC